MNCNVMSSDIVNCKNVHHYCYSLFYAVCQRQAKRTLINVNYYTKWYKAEAFQV